MGSLVTLTRAQSIRQGLRTEGKTVVLTNGVFDILHVGHLRCLKAARKLGDALFVGLNSDRSARHLKGPSRPLVPQAERAEVLCALVCVDYVTIFEELTAEHLVQALKPDVYAKGGDYAAETIAASAGEEDTTGSEVVKPLPEAPIAESYGGCVVILPYECGHSTSRIIAGVLSMCDRARRG